MSLRILSDAEDGAIVLAGRMDSAVPEAVQTALLAAVGTRSGAVAVLDVAGVDYVSSAGLRLLVLLAKRAAADGGSVGLRGAGAMLRELLELSDLLDVFALLDPPAG